MNTLVAAVKAIQSLHTETPKTFPAEHRGRYDSIVKGVCRHWFECDDIASQLWLKKPKDEAVRIIIYCGIFQLRYFDTNPAKVVSEAVNACKPLKVTSASGMVNRVLRDYLRKKPEPKTIEGQTNHPSWLIEKLKAAYPSDYHKFIDGNNKTAPIGFFCLNEDYLAKHKLTKLEQHPWAKNHFITRDLTVSEIPGIETGEIYFQDAAAKLAVDLLKAQKGDLVLDVCAAPGGKSLALLATGASVISSDINPGRVNRMLDNFSRYPVDAIPLIADGASLPFQECFDKVLLDAPCSALGLLRRHPEIRFKRTPKEIEAVTQIQAKLLKEAFRTLKPGGILLYATCSTLPEENQEQIELFCTAQHDAEVVQIDAPWGTDTGFGRVITPLEADMDGFFIAKVAKRP